MSDRANPNNINGRSRMLTIRLPHETADRVDAEAERRGVSRTELVKVALTDWLPPAAPGAGLFD